MKFRKFISNMVLIFTIIIGFSLQVFANDDVNSNFMMSQISITDIRIPGPADQHTFVIEASSEITNFNHFFLEDGRIVIDIHNSVLNAPGQQTVDTSPNVSLVRAAQNTDENGVEVTRIVIQLDLLSSIYTVSLSEDMKSIYVHFEENVINDISISTDNNADYLTITGVRQPNVIISNIYGKQNITIDMYNTRLNDINIPTLSGNFIDGGFIQQEGYNTIRINLKLNQNVSYTILNDEDNTIKIKIEDTTFNNISYDEDENVLILRQTIYSPIAIDSIIHNYDDFHSGYILTLPYNFSNFYGYGNLEINNDFISNVDISTEDGRTIITMGINQFIALDVIEEDGYIYMYIVNPKDKYERIVMLDPGHGGSDPGAAHFDLIEKDLVLTISNITKELLKQDESIKVFSTRTTDVFVPLVDRAELANEAADLFVSIHFNSSFDMEERGTETYYLEDETDEYFNITRLEVAEVFQRNLVETLGTEDRGIKTANFSVLRNTNIPSVLLEIGFISNKEENNMFMDTDMQAKVGQVIYESIIEIFEVYNPPRY